MKYFPLLQSIVLTWGTLYGTLPADLVEMKHLINIEANENKFSGSIPDQWWGAKRLFRLNLSGNQLTGTVSTLIGNMQDMRGLFLFENLLTGTIPPEIGELSSLMYIHLDNNILTGSIPSEVTKMSRLETLWLHKNTLTGSLPDNIGSLSAMRHLKLKGNKQLGGTLPDSFYKLTKLDRLDLGECQFSGQLDPRIAEFELSLLALNNNNFTGPFPQGNWTAISRIEIAGTDLTGTIPQALCNRRGDNVFSIQTLEANCKEVDGGKAELECNCCTLCCNSDGDECEVP